MTSASDPLAPRGIVAVRRRWLFRFVALALALLGCVGLLELLAAAGLLDFRLVFHTHGSHAWENPRNPFDAELMHRHGPHDEFSGRLPGDLVAWLGIRTDRLYNVHVRYDKNGFRNSTDRDAADVIVLGDSFVEGSTVSFDSLASTRMEALLHRPVMNLGQAGYGPQQERIVLRRFGLPVHPRVVVWVLFEGNDVVRDYARFEDFRARPQRYRAEQHGYRVRGFVRNAFKALDRAGVFGSPAQSGPLKQYGVLNPPSQAAGSTLYFAYDSNALTASDQEHLDRVLDLIGDAANATRQAGAHFVFAFAPIKFRVYHDLCAFEPDSEPARWKLNDMNDRCAAWADARGVPFVDLTTALRRSAVRGDLLYYLDDGHWNAEGHAVVAAELAEFIERAGWLSGASSASSTSR